MIKRKPMKIGLRGSRKPIKRSGRGLGRTKRPKTGKGKGTKIWGLRRADLEFRRTMLEAAPVKCVFPGCTITDPKKLTVSHYHGRANKATRFYIPNCDFICRTHHYWDKQLGWEFQKQTKEKHGWDGRYTLYMKEKLPNPEFRYLKYLAESGMKQKTAIQNFQNSLTTLSTNH